VAVRGHLVPSATDFVAVTAVVQRVAKDGTRVDHTGRVGVDAEARFLLPAVPLKPWEDTYELRIEDPSGTYQTRSFALFALAGDAVDYGDIQMTRVAGDSLTVVRGNVLSAMNGTALSGVSVTLDGEGATTTTTTDAMGAFSFDAVRIGARKLTLDGTQHGYVLESRDLSLAASPENMLDRSFLVPRSTNLDVTLIFSTPSSTACRAVFVGKNNHPGKLPAYSHLSTPTSTFDINHAYGYQRERWDSSGLTLPAGFGFGTSFWPPFLSALGGAKLAPQDRFLFGMTHDATTTIETYDVAGTSVVEGKFFGYDDQWLETMVVRQASFLATVPTKLAYYYVLTDGTRHYPVGTLLYSVWTECFDKGEVRVYRKEERIARFALPAKESSQQVGEFTEWAPVVIEYGYTTANPTGNSDIYLDVLPLTALDLTHGAEPQAYERRAGTDQPGQGWSHPPASLSLGAKGASQSYFVGVDSQSTTGVWYLDASKRILQAAQDTVSSGIEILAVGTINRSRTFDPPMFAYRSQGALYYREGRFDDSFAVGSSSFTCGVPTTLGTVSGLVLVGTTTGLAYPDCHTSTTLTSSAPWLDDLVRRTPTASISYIGEQIDAQGHTVVLLGTANGSLWTARSGVSGTGWALVKGITSTAAVVGAVDYDATAFVATARDGLYFGLDSGRMVGAIPVGTGPGMFPRRVYSDEVGSEVDLELKSLAVYADRLYVGTNAGIWEYDRRRTLECGRPPSAACLEQALRRLRGVPAIAFPGLVSGVGRFYGLSGKGLFEIVAP
jgi:hypothetical protein